MNASGHWKRFSLYQPRCQNRRPVRRIPSAGSWMTRSACSAVVGALIAAYIFISSGIYGKVDFHHAPPFDVWAYTAFKYRHLQFSFSVQSPSLFQALQFLSCKRSPRSNICLRPRSTRHPHIFRSRILNSVHDMSLTCACIFCSKSCATLIHHNSFHSNYLLKSISNYLQSV